MLKATLSLDRSIEQCRYYDLKGIKGKNLAKSNDCFLCRFIRLYSRRDVRKEWDKYTVY